MSSSITEAAFYQCRLSSLVFPGKTYYRHRKDTYFTIMPPLRMSKIMPQPISRSGWSKNKFPAKDHCSLCGLCETSFVSNVTQACAFLPNWGMSRIDALEGTVHGRQRQCRIKDDEARLGVLHEPIRLVRGKDIVDAQWTGVVTGIALAMLESKQVDAVVCIAAAQDNNTTTSSSSSSSWSTPEPILAKTPQDVLKGRGVKPSLAPSLAVLDDIQADPSIRRLLLCGVGCAVQAFRAVQDDLDLDEVFVLGTNCVDNSPTPQAAETFLREGVKLPTDEHVLGYEFMQDFRVHVKTKDRYITKPYFSLPGTIAAQSIAPSCLACFDYTNALADVVVGYMGAPLLPGSPRRMDQSLQTLTVRNARGATMVQTAVDLGRLHVGELASGTGSRHERLASATVLSDAHVQAMVGDKVPDQGVPVWLGEILAFVLRSTGPKGLNFARYSIDYHILRNYLHLLATSNPDVSIPEYARNIVEFYLQSDQNFRNIEDRVKEQRKLLGP